MGPRSWIRKARTSRVLITSPAWRRGRMESRFAAFTRGVGALRTRGFAICHRPGTRLRAFRIDRPAGHSFGAVLARLVFVFMMRNARKRVQRVPFVRARKP